MNKDIFSVKSSLLIVIICIGVKFNLKANTHNIIKTNEIAFDIIKSDTIKIPKNLADFFNGLNLEDFNFQDKDSLFSHGENLLKNYRFNIDSLGINQYLDDNFNDIYDDHKFNSDSLKSSMNNSKLFEQIQQMMQNMFEQFEITPDSNSYELKDDFHENKKPGSKSKFRKL